MRLFIKLLLAAGLFAIGNSSFAQAQTEIKETTYKITSRQVQGFNEIKLQGPFDVYVIQGNQGEIKLDAPDEILSRIVTEVSGGVLKIHNKHDNWGWGENSWYGDKSWWNKHKRVTVYITAKDVKRVTISGSGKIFWNDGITAGALKLRVRGSGRMEGKIGVQIVRSHISGSGRIELSGTAETSAAKISGSGNFSARNLVTSSSAVHVSGSGHAEVNANSVVDASVSGSAHVGYAGSPKKINSSKSGSGSISSL